MFFTSSYPMDVVGDRAVESRTSLQVMICQFVLAAR